MIWVDDWQQPATVGRITSRWSHMTADSLDELHALAGRLGLRRAWFQSGVNHTYPHYDLTEGMRRRAIALGAIPETWREAGRRTLANRRAVAVSLGGEAFGIMTRGGEVVRGPAQYLGRDERELAGELRAQGARFAGIRPADLPEIEAGQEEIRAGRGPLRILVTGSRDWADRESVALALAPWRWLDAVLVSGHARGLDRLCESVWRSWGKGEPETHVPDWDAGRAAGHRRNAEMIRAGAWRCVSFGMQCELGDSPEPHLTHGTGGCVKGAEAAGIEVIHHGWEPEAG